ncbi:MAG: 3-phosphoshikimate 1-carboxyvinyltransferase, partial [Gemmatimonadota bacterium]|nr:3-phosphoshikimate 1-carboxyvinyltransferase [Gemmatimonadota bacterium]
MEEHITPVGKISGGIRVPGDKSISHRALIFSALASGTSTIEGLSRGEDVKSTAACLEALGARIENVEECGSTVRVTGAGETGFVEPSSPLDAGNSGTTMRLLAGILAAQSFDCSITGDKYLRRRPMRRVIEPLTQMGAKIEASEGGLPPLRFIGGCTLDGIRYSLPVPSAQVKSCVLLAGLFARGTTTVIEQTPSRDHTERMLPLFGVEVEKQGPNGQSGQKISVRGGSHLRAADIRVPGDPSSAAFFAAGAAMLPGGEINIENICLNPTRAAFFDVLESMGAHIERRNERYEAGEPVADLVVRAGRLKAVEVGGRLVPSLIDEVPVLAVAATQAEGVTRITGAAELRVKETDRLAAVSKNLTLMGARVKELADGLEIEGPCRLRGAVLDSYGDHR